MRQALLRLALELVAFMHDELVGLTPEPPKPKPLCAPTPMPHVTAPLPPCRFTADQLALVLAVAEEIDRGVFVYLEAPRATPPYPATPPWPTS